MAGKIAPVSSPGPLILSRVPETGGPDCLEAANEKTYDNKAETFSIPLSRLYFYHREGEEQIVGSLNKHSDREQRPYKSPSVQLFACPTDWKVRIYKHV